MKAKLLALLLLSGSSMFAARVFVGVGFGGYVVAPPRPVVTYVAPPRPVPVAYVPPAPYVGATWIGGYWYPVGPRWSWHAGYWARRPFVGAAWVAPRYYGHRYYGGYWRR